MDLDLEDLTDEEIFLATGALVPVAGALALNPGLSLRAWSALSQAFGSMSKKLMVILGVASVGIAKAVWQMRRVQQEWESEEQLSFFSDSDDFSLSPGPQKPAAFVAAEEPPRKEPLELLPTVSVADRIQLVIEQEEIIEAYNQALRSHGAEIDMRLERISKRERSQIMEDVVLGRMAELSSYSQRYFSRFLVVFKESDLIKKDLLSSSDLFSIEDQLRSVVVIYAKSGCAPKNPGPGGWGVLLSYGDYARMVKGSYAPRTTNKRMEIAAVIEGLKCLKRGGLNVGVYTTSRYVCHAVNFGWLRRWKGNGWKTIEHTGVSNQDFWRELDGYLKIHQLQFFHVKGRGGVEGDERVGAALEQARRQRINRKRDWVYERICGMRAG